MTNKLMIFYKYPFYRKIDCIKDYFYRLKSFLFIKKNKFDFYDGNLDNSFINNYSKLFNY